MKENLADDDPFYNELYIMYGQFAYHIKDYPKALKYYKDALKVAEDHSDQNAIRSIVLCTAVTLSKMGQEDEMKKMAIKYVLSLKTIENRLKQEEE